LFSLVGVINLNILEAEDKTKLGEEGSGGQPLVQVVALLECLTSNNTDGRVVCSRAASIGKASIKYLLLNPAPTFAHIVSKARYCTIVSLH
jgi:hypothetical protein